MEKRNVFLKIEYDGTVFFGWQRQPKVRTVQGELERVLSVLCDTDIKLNGTSRTDAGVHALCQCATFEAAFGIPVERIPVAANNLMAGGKPVGGISGVGDVRIISAEEVEPGFHARFNAKGKKYIYRIRCAGEPDIFLKNYRYQITDKLDTDAMRKASKYIVGTHDFKCFQASGGEEKETTVRSIYSLDITERKAAKGWGGAAFSEENAEGSARDIDIEIAGDGFLYNMVRIIAGTLVEVGLGKRKPEELKTIIESCDRQMAGHTAPPQGLYLKEVYYDEVPRKAESAKSK